MTLQSPRIYIYKITFEEVSYYYYGVKKEEYYNQEYWGSPYTNKWCWKLYTPKKQILQFFPYTDNGWLEAQEVEKRLIRPVYNTDKWCLNESCAGKISLKISRDVGLRHKKNKTGICGLSEEERVENAIKNYNNGGGLATLTLDQRWEYGEKGRETQKEYNLGLYSISKENRSKTAKSVNSQKWQCMETGYITNSGALSTYQKVRGIDTSKRIRLN